MNCLFPLLEPTKDSLLLLYFPVVEVVHQQLLLLHLLLLFLPEPLPGLVQI